MELYAQARLMINYAENSCTNSPFTLNRQKCSRFVELPSTLWQFFLLVWYPNLILLFFFKLSSRCSILVFPSRLSLWLHPWTNSISFTHLRYFLEQSFPAFMPILLIILAGRLWVSSDCYLHLSVNFLFPSSSPHSIALFPFLNSSACRFSSVISPSMASVTTYLV